MIVLSPNGHSNRIVLANCAGRCFFTAAGSVRFSMGFPRQRAQRAYAPTARPIEMIVF